MNIEFPLNRGLLVYQYFMNDKLKISDKQTNIRKLRLCGEKNGSYIVIL